MNFNFINVLLLHFGHQHVSATKCGQLHDDFFEKKKIMNKMCRNDSTVLGSCIFLVKIHY